MYSGILGDTEGETSKDFYELLAAEMIENKLDHPRNRFRLRRNPIIPSRDSYHPNGQPKSGIGIHLSPTKKRRVNKGQETKALAENFCRECKQFKSSTVCSKCRDENPDKREVFLCNIRTGRNCFAEHVAQEHN